MNEKRRYQRIVVTNASADLSCNGFVFPDCTVGDISETGLRIDDVPKRFVGKNTTQIKDIGNITAIIQHKNKHIRLKIAPKWATPDEGGRVSIGFEVADSVDMWNTFVKSRTSLIRQDTDVWGNRGMKHLHRNAA